VFAALSGTDGKARIAVIGLGAGSLACYGASLQQFSFYEIDPAVERIARDSRYFTFLRDCFPQVNVVLGDARISFQKAPDQHYGLIILDAFSSDSIPIHLITREAVQLYLSKLSRDGILAFHISNTHLDLRPVLGRLAADARLAILAQDDFKVTEVEIKRGKASSQWVVMAPKKDALAKLSQDERWVSLDGGLERRVWTDDFSNILSVVRWK
jgi:spermidine synthase